MKNQKILQKIIHYIDVIINYTNNVSYEEFNNNSMMVEACVFNLSQIGELVNKLDIAFISNFPEVPWFKMKVRNK